MSNTTSFLMDEFRVTAKKDKDYEMSQEAEFDVLYPTGFLNLDFLNGQRVHVNDPDNGRVFDYDSFGIVDGSINAFIGRSGCGKSTIVKQMAANIVRQFPEGLIFEDSVEGGMVHRRNEILTRFSPQELEKKVLIRNAGVTAESFYKRIKMIYDIKTANPDKFRYDTGLFDSRGNRIFKFQPTVYILDSLAMLMPKKVTEEEELSGQMSATAAAKMIAGIFRRIVPLLKAANIIVFVINHITTKIEINSFVHTKSQNIYLKPDETCPGGVTPFYTYNNVFRLDDGNKLSEGKDLDIAGSIVEVTLVKSRTNRAGAMTRLVFNQDIGFDPELSMLITLKDNGRINGAGAFLYIGLHSDKKFAQKNFKSKIFEDEEFRRYYYEECIDFLKASLHKEQVAFAETCKIDTASEMIGMINQSYGITQVT